MKSLGAELINRIHAGELQKATSEHVDKTRTAISSALEELLDIGARIRPLYVDGVVQGWVRGIHLAERKILERWVHDPYNLAVERLLLATSLPREAVEGMTGSELRSLIRLVNEMSESDIRLYPYMSAFVSTSLSEQMWFARGTEITKYQRREVVLPGGASMIITAPPDHARLWANLCHYREVAKQRLDQSMNTLLIVRPWVGRSADSLSNDLRNTAKKLVTDSLEPWQGVVRADKTVVDDGWAHGGDDSIESLQRELQGMAANDRHEQLIAKFEKQERDRAEIRQREIDEKIAARGGPGFMHSVIKPMTEKEAQEITRRLQRGRPAAVAGDEVEQSPGERLAKYR